MVVVLADRKSLRGYLNPSRLGQNGPVDLLSPDGEHTEIPLERLRSIYFVREFSDEFEPERKAFLSRPKLDGLWVRLRYSDGETLEGVIPNDLLNLLDNGVQITPAGFQFEYRSHLCAARGAARDYRARSSGHRTEEARCRSCCGATALVQRMIGGRLTRLAARSRPC